MVPFSNYIYAQGSPFSSGNPVEIRNIDAMSKEQAKDEMQRIITYWGNSTEPAKVGSLQNIIAKCNDREIQYEANMLLVKTAFDLSQPPKIENGKVVAPVNFSNEYWDWDIDLEKCIFDLKEFESERGIAFKASLALAKDRSTFEGMSRFYELANLSPYKYKDAQELNAVKEIMDALLQIPLANESRINTREFSRQFYPFTNVEEVTGLKYDDTIFKNKSFKFKFEELREQRIFLPLDPNKKPITHFDNITIKFKLRENVLDARISGIFTFKDIDIELGEQFRPPIYDRGKDGKNIFFARDYRLDLDLRRDIAREKYPDIHRGISLKPGVTIGDVYFAADINPYAMYYNGPSGQHPMIKGSGDEINLESIDWNKL